MAYAKYKDWTERAESDKDIRKNAFKVTKTPKHDAYERGLASMVYTFFDQKSKGSGIKSMSNQQLTDEVHELIIWKFKKRLFYFWRYSLNKHTQQRNYVLIMCDW